jgi:hypothetical protein
MKTLNALLNVTALTAVAALASTPALASGNLLSNGGFNVSAQLDNWQVSKTQNSFLRVQDFLRAGDGYLYVKDAPASIAQSFNTVAGQALSIAFDYQLQKTDPNQTLSVLFNGQSLFSTSTANAGVGAGAWASFQTSAVATGRDSLSFVFNSVGVSASTAMTLDNVSVTAVPEPSSMALLGMGVAGLAWFRRRQSAR